jgi:hypothetical protein
VFGFVLGFIKIFLFDMCDNFQGQLEVWTFPKLEIEEKVATNDYGHLSPIARGYHSSQSLSDSLRITEAFDTIPKEKESHYSDAVSKDNHDSVTNNINDNNKPQPQSPRSTSRQSGMGQKRKIVRPFVISSGPKPESGETSDGTLVLEAFATGPIRMKPSFFFFHCHVFPFHFLLFCFFALWIQFLTL